MLTDLSLISGLSDLDENGIVHNVDNNNLYDNGSGYELGLYNSSNTQKQVCLYYLVFYFKVRFKHKFDNELLENTPKLSSYVDLTHMSVFDDVTPEFGICSSDTSIWFEGSGLNNNSSDIFKTDFDTESKIFKTDDHLPRSLYSDLASTKDQIYTSNNFDSANYLPRQFSKGVQNAFYDMSPVSSLLELSLHDQDSECLDSKSYTEKHNFNDLSKPNYQTADLLMEEIKELTSKINLDLNLVSLLLYDYLNYIMK